MESYSCVAVICLKINGAVKIIDAAIHAVKTSISEKVMTVVFADTRKMSTLRYILFAKNKKGNNI